VDAGPAAEGVDLDAGIISEGEAAGGAGSRAGLGRGVLGVGNAGLLDVEGDAQLGGRHEFVARGSEQAPQFGDLAGVVRRQEEARHGSSFAGGETVLKPPWYRFANRE
jgi:hypothetical protein